MALDGIYLSKLKEEFAPLIGGRVDKIHQPSREEILIALRTRENGVKRLIINTGAGSARVHITDAKIENPKAPPMFCMLLRKHLSSGKLADIRQEGFERILYFDFDAANEMGDTVRLTLAAEIMGRRSNLILISGGKIIDSIKRVGQDMSSVRPILPGMSYSLPPKDIRENILECSEEEFFSALEKNPNAGISKGIMKGFEGISPVFAGECEYICTNGGEMFVKDMGEKNRELLWSYIENFRRDLSRGENKYTILKDGGKFKDFCLCDICQYGELMEKIYFESPSVLLDYFYTQRDILARTKQRAADLFTLLNSAIQRTKRRVENQKAELKECSEREKLKICGDLIMANMYAVSKGQGLLKAENFYEEGSPVVEIKLDKRLTPSGNAQKYYKEYRKLDTAEKMLKGLIAQGEEEIRYLDSVYDALTRAQTEGDIMALREELAETGYAKRKRIKGKAPKALPPMEFELSHGYRVRVGRNNKQNDMLTCKESKKTDIWFHVKEITGSHVILDCGEETPPDEVIEEAAGIAAYFSKGRESSRVDVDYTRIRNVKKPNGAKPGMVIFVKNYTVTVPPALPKKKEEKADGQTFG